MLNVVDMLLYGLLHGVETILQSAYFIVSMGFGNSLVVVSLRESLYRMGQKSQWLQYLVYDEKAERKQEQQAYHSEGQSALLQSGVAG